MRIRVGVTCNQDWGKGQVYLEDSYLKAIDACGALPVLLPPTMVPEAVPVYAELVDALLLSGGGDVDPVYFGEEPRVTGRVTPERDQLEISLARCFLQLDKPMLAICRGLQVLNIAAGGDIFQDLSLARDRDGLIKHRQDAPPWYPTHGVAIQEGSLLAGICGQSRLRVNSFHHQAVRRVAEGMVVAAVAADGIVEAIESRQHRFVVGVQWHPEYMWERDSTQQKLFIEFIRAAQG